ncbi:MAG: hypothetical protein AB1540_12390 [Bdellovibrionota bacterium]
MRSWFTPRFGEGFLVKAIRKKLYLAIPALLLCALSALAVTKDEPEQSELDQYILCHRDGEVRALDAEFDSSDSCSGTAKIQGISYKCGRPEETEVRVSRFLEDLKIKGRKQCEAFCQARGKDCHGVFTAPQKCGFTLNSRQAAEYGQHMARCNPDRCEGTAFIYCSIYQASYLRFEESMMKKKEPNCRCERRASRKK